MSNRYSDYDKGSSRSTGDDSRRHEGRYEGRERDSVRSRSRSPRRTRSPDSRSSRHGHGDRHRSSRDKEYDGYHSSSKDRHSSSRSHHDREDHDEVPAPPPPPRITKISIDLSKPKAPPIKMSLGSSSKVAPQKSKPTVASVFNADDDSDDDEEMPAEARMRMRNIGRDTPTSAGPNSFGKTKQGFCDAKKVFEKNLKQALDQDAAGSASTAPTKQFLFPQTIYKIKP